MEEGQGNTSQNVRQNRRDLENATKIDTTNISAITEDGLTGRNLLNINKTDRSIRPNQDINKNLIHDESPLKSDADIQFGSPIPGERQIRKSVIDSEGDI